MLEVPALKPSTGAIGSVMQSREEVVLKRSYLDETIPEKVRAALFAMVQET